MTAAELDRLAPAWSIRHDVDDVPGLGGNIDHIVVAPAGVFVVDSKRWLRQRVGIAGNRITVTRTLSHRSRRSQDGIGRGARRQAAALRRVIKTRSRIPRWVTPVIAVWAESCPSASEVDGVWLVPGPQLLKWLQARPAPMHWREAELIMAAITHRNADAKA